MHVTSAKAKIRAEAGYQARVSARRILRKRECSRWLGCSARQIDKFETDGTLQFQLRGKQKVIGFPELEIFMPGGGGAWMSASDAAQELGTTKRKLELMRKCGEGPIFKFFSPKLLRYLGSSIADFKAIVSPAV